MHGLPVEVWFVGSYALFLALAAAGLESLAERSLRRSDRYELAGFNYRYEMDRWECPTGHHLVRVQTDPNHRLVRYRAPAHACNACHIKTHCTDSEMGREIERRVDSWLETEIGRFHRGVSVALLSVAAVLLGIEACRFTQPPDLIFLGLLLGLVGVIGLRFLRSVQISGGQTENP